MKPLFFIIFFFFFFLLFLVFFCEKKVQVLSESEQTQRAKRAALSGDRTRWAATRACSVAAVV